MDERAEAQFLPDSVRQELMTEGIRQLEIWLNDVILVGILQFDFSESNLREISSRMVDAKLGGLARRIRLLGELAVSDPAWSYHVLRQLSSLYLVVQGFYKRDSKTLPFIQSLYGIAGYHISKSDLKDLPSIEDEWLVCGIIYQTEENLTSREVWLMGRHSRRSAMLLDFAFGRNPFDFPVRFTQSLKGDLVYYPGLFALRAHLFQPKSIARVTSYPAYFEDISSFLEVYAQTVATNPWIHRFPACIRHLQLIPGKDGFSVRDRSAWCLPLKTTPEILWPVLASLADHSCPFFGIWDGKQLEVLSFQWEEVILEVDNQVPKARPGNAI